MYRRVERAEYDGGRSSFNGGGGGGRVSGTVIHRFATVGARETLVYYTTRQSLKEKGSINAV